MATMKNLSMAPIGRYIDPLTDFGFKRIFGSEPHKDLLIAFLNELFKGRKVIRDLVYNPQESGGPAKHHRKTIVDLICTGMEGETFIIEMQRAGQKFFTDRAVFYTASKLQAQGPKGSKHWNFELKEVYFVGLTDFNFKHSRPGKYLHHARLIEEETGEVFYNKLGFIFLELPNFNMGPTELETDLERWMYILRNMAQLDKIPVNLHQEIFKKLFKIAEIANLKKEEYMLYQKDVLDKWTEYSVLETAEEKGLEKGAAQKGYEVVCNLLSGTNFDVAKIAALAGVTEAFVKKVKISLKERK
ncbi:Rpn family recombination-promoting nuclease/putative transposase [Niabella sp.]|uniref:Rpn family recombination-promoting nuclease/putative transposase n=1 Tax=Niabella sp. TaxID=1962976 RepID=UPI00261103F9|nr:Rpn family recombination-promoting nuclease/putative transposase [Niabella sp.]